jgi:hypothetical protein
MLNLAVIGVGGVLLIPLGRMGWGFERILEEVGVYFVTIPDLSRETGPRLDSRMMCSTVSWPSRKLSRFYMALLVIRMPVLQLTWTFLVVPFSGMLKWVTIGR